MKLTLSKYFAQLRKERELSFDDIAHRTKLNRSTPWKIESGKAVKGETVRLIATKGLGIDPASDEYLLLSALWCREAGVFGPERDGEGLVHAVSLLVSRENAETQRNARDLGGSLVSLGEADAITLIAALKSKVRRKYVLAAAKA